MRRLLFVMAVIGTALLFDFKLLLGQQRRTKVITFPRTTITKTQFSPDAANPAPGSPDNPAVNPSPSNNLPSTANGTPNLLPGSGTDNSAANNSATAVASNATGPQSNSATSDPNGANDVSQRPTYQQMLNPAGGYQMTHTGFSQGQYTSANNYLGSQFNNWNNLQVVPNSLNGFDAFNRTQPTPYSAGYTDQSLYMGPMNNAWSNMFSGTPIPNYLGSWIYQQ